MADKPVDQLRARDLSVGVRYLHRNGLFVREILAFEGGSVHWRDQFSEGHCSKAAFLKACPSRVATHCEDNSSAVSQGNPLTLRDEANALTAFAFRNGFIEELHAGKVLPQLRQPGYSRISDDEMRRLMIEASAKLEEMLRMMKDNPVQYAAFIRDYHSRFCVGWKR